MTCRQNRTISWVWCLFMLEWLIDQCNIKQQSQTFLSSSIWANWPVSIDPDVLSTNLLSFIVFNALCCHCCFKARLVVCKCYFRTFATSSPALERSQPLITTFENDLKIFLYPLNYIKWKILFEFSEQMMNSVNSTICLSYTVAVINQISMFAQCFGLTMIVIEQAVSYRLYN